MFSKFTVLSKLCKHSHFKRYGPLYISRFNSMPTRRLSKNANRLLVVHEFINQNDCCTLNLLDSVPKRNYSIKFIRNLSSTGKDGDQTDKSNPNQNVDKKKKDIMQRRWKVKRLKTVKVKCKRCKKLHVNKFEVGTPETDETVVKKDIDLNTLKAEPVRVLNDEGISQSHLPPKKLHVEFMESQNLKDFNLNKDQPNNTLNKKPNVIDIKIFPIKVSDEKSSLNIFQMVAKNNVPALKPKSPENLNKNTENLPVLANMKNPDNKSITESSSDLAQQKINTNVPQQMKTKSLSDLRLHFQIRDNSSEKPKELIYDRSETTSRSDRTIHRNMPKSDILPEQRKSSSATELKDNALIKPNSRDLANPKSSVESSPRKYSDLPKVSSFNQNILHKENTNPKQDTSFRKTNQIRVLYQARPKKKKIAGPKYKDNFKNITNPELKQENPSSNISKANKEFYTKSSEIKFKDVEARALKLKKYRAKWLKAKESFAKLKMLTTPLENKSKQSQNIDTVIKANEKKEEPSTNKSISHSTAFGELLNNKTMEMGETIVLHPTQESDELKKTERVLYPTNENDKSTLKAIKSDKETKVLPSNVDTFTLKTVASKQELDKSTSTGTNEVKSGLTDLTADMTASKTAAVNQELSKSTSTSKNEVTPGLTNSTASPHIADITASKTAAVKQESNRNTSSGKNEVKPGLANFTEQLHQKQIKKTEKEEIKKTYTKWSETVSGSKAKKTAVKSSPLKKQIAVDKFRKTAETILKEVKYRKLKLKEGSEAKKTALKSSTLKTQTADDKFQKVAKTVLEDIKNKNLKLKEDQAINKKKTVSSEPLENVQNMFKKSSVDDLQVSNNWPKNMFGEYMSPEKLKQVEEKLKIINGGTPQASESDTEKRNSQSQSNLIGTTNLRTSNATKFRPHSRGGSNRGGGNRGDDGEDDNNFKCGTMAGKGGDGGDDQCGTMSNKAAPSRFWRNLSLSILPLLIAVTVYLFSSTEAISMLTRMHLTSTKDPFDIKVLPAFYETDSESDTPSPQRDDEMINENDTDSEAVEVENVMESETDNLFEDHRLDEA